MVDNERMAEAERLLARERMLQEMRTSTVRKQRDTRRRLLWTLVPLGSILGGLVSPMVDLPSIVPMAAGMAGGGILAVLLAQRAG